MGIKLILWILAILMGVYGVMCGAYIAIRKIWDLPPMAHRCLFPSLSGTLNILKHLIY